MDYVDPRPSRRLILCARLLSAVCLLSGALLILSPVEPEPVPPTTVPGTTVPTPRLRASGLGPVMVGMPWAAAVMAGVVELQVLGCQVGQYQGATVYGQGGTVTALVVQDEGLRTLRGIGVGSSRAEVAAFYSTSAEGEAVTVVEGSNVLLFGFRDDVVTYVYAGRPDGAGC